MTPGREPQPPEQPRRSRIPEFASREEAAHWFDTHDIGDYLDEFEIVDGKPAKKITHIIQIELDSETFRALCTLGRNKRTNPIHLAKRWIVERLKEET